MNVFGWAPWSRRVVRWGVMIGLAIAVVGCHESSPLPITDTTQSLAPAQSAEANDLLSLYQRSKQMAAVGHKAEAIELLLTHADRLGDEPGCEAWLASAFIWALDIRQYDRAERLAEVAVDQFPDSVESHRRMAQWLASTGRRHEASDHVRRLIRRDAADFRETLSLVQVSGPFELVSFAAWTGDQPPAMFSLARARHAIINDGDAKTAIEWIEQLPATKRTLAPVLALEGRALATLDQADRQRDWFERVSQLPTSAKINEQPEYWLAVGLMLQSRGEDRASLSPLAAVVRIDPTEREALRSIVAALTRLDDREGAAKVQSGLAKLDEVFREAALADAEGAMRIGFALESLVRPREALQWYRRARQMGSTSVTDQMLIARAEAIKGWEAKLSDEQIRSARVAAVLGELPASRRVDTASLDARVARLGELLLVDGSDAAKVADATPSIDETAFRYRNVAPECGLDTVFHSGYELDSGTYWLHQVNGGGMAAADFDRDGNVDVYVMQSGGDPNLNGSSRPNELYRNVSADHSPDGESIRFTEVAAAAGVDDRGFGQGVCAGDWNQDGFIDLLLANIGPNRLLLNQGDGTFREASDSVWPLANRWTSSIAMGDLDGDQLPDVVEVNYIDDPRVFRTKCTPSGGACRPQDYRAASDRMLRTTADGKLIAGDLMDELCVPNYGMGVVLGNLDRRGGNDVFISNDADLNHFYQSVTATDPAATDHAYTMVESASLAGCAVGSTGYAQACMGIAAGDIDRDGNLDLAITNFHNEPMNLFRQTSPGFFVDDARGFQLSRPSRSMLGFGTQVGDIDNDGWLDLVVLNGHLYDDNDESIPFRMRPQVFRGGPGPFVPVKFDDGYFSKSALGRTLVRFDVNRDGRVDWLANHLDKPIAVLVNQTDAGHWIEMELVGTTSPRDPVGAWVDVRVGEQTLREYCFGGDGYMTTSEAVLHFGLGGQTDVDSVEVHWPDGMIQTLESRAWADRRWIVVQGSPAEPSD